MNSPEIKKIIRENKSLFWSVRKDQMENVSHEALVETILNFGTEKSIKKLFDLLGIKKVSQIFYKQISLPRKNYFPRTINFFNLYFKRNAH